MFCAVSGAPETTVRLHGSLKGLMGLRKTVRVMIYYSERIQIKMGKGKDAWGKVQEKPGVSFQKFFLAELSGYI